MGDKFLIIFTFKLRYCKLTSFDISWIISMYPFKLISKTHKLIKHFIGSIECIIFSDKSSIVNDLFVFKNFD